MAMMYLCSIKWLFDAFVAAIRYYYYIIILFCQFYTCLILKDPCMFLLMLLFDIVILEVVQGFGNIHGAGNIVCWIEVEGCMVVKLHMCFTKCKLLVFGALMKAHY